MLLRALMIPFLLASMACWHQHPLTGLPQSEEDDCALCLLALTGGASNAGTMVLTGSTSGFTYQGGGSHVVQISLSEPPSGTVTVTASCSASCEGSPSPSSLSFTDANYNTPQTVTISGIDDATFDIADTSYTITFTSSSGGSIDISLTNLGDRRIFQSATTSSPNLGGIVGADAICMADGSKPAGTSTYKAMLTASSTRVACTSAYCATSGTAEHTDWVFLPHTHYYRRDGSLIVLTTNASGILGSGETLTNTIWTAGFNRAFSGVNADWTMHGARCANWTYGGAGGGGVHWGHTSNTSSNFWSQSNDGSCAFGTYPIICVEQ